LLHQDEDLSAVSTLIEAELDRIALSEVGDGDGKNESASACGVDDSSDDDDDSLDDDVTQKDARISCKHPASDRPVIKKAVRGKCAIRKCTYPNLVHDHMCHGQGCGNYVHNL